MKLATLVSSLRKYLDFFDQYNLLPGKAVRQMSDPRFLRAFAKTILQAKKPRLAGHRFSIINLRTLRGRHADVLLAIDAKLKCRPSVLAFVGHRFVNQVTKNLRHNLQRVLKPYRIQLVYSDRDMLNSQVFNVILRHIKDVDFCIFDDRATEARPNVFIELGATIALGRPYLYFNFQRKRAVVMNGTKLRIETPSDLMGMLCLPYSTYEELFFELATRLPGFLTARKLVTR